MHHFVPGGWKAEADAAETESEMESEEAAPESELEDAVTMQFPSVEATTIQVPSQISLMPLEFPIAMLLIPAEASDILITIRKDKRAFTILLTCCT